jgi:UDP-N-acetylglucosamine/UDP-N-acetylgalactosamine diphosphorylase
MGEGIPKFGYERHKTLQHGPDASNISCDGLGIEIMSKNATYESIRKMLEEQNQSHLLAAWEHLDAAQRRSLLDQIVMLDFEKIDDWVANVVNKYTPPARATEFSPACSYPPLAQNPEMDRKYREARRVGKAIISAGKVAPLVVAGGQGTRLGSAGPKGDFAISPVKNKTLFQIFAETIAAVSEKYGTARRWYVMTSPLNHTRIQQIFCENDYYGLDSRDVFIFQQGTLPNFSFDGKILLADKANIACSPDGHGGSLKALAESGALEDMKKRGIQFISYFHIDNPLVNIFDPLFIGLHALDGAEMSSKALEKSRPKEKVGNFCLVDGKITVIEYSDLPDEMAEKRDPDGSLVFGLASIGIHIINVSFVEKLNAGGFSLPLHRAVKNIPCIDGDGNLVESPTPNGIKLETFVFDALPMASKSIIFRTVRAQEFGPAKNGTGNDSAKIARQMMNARATDWLESAGVTVPRRENGAPDCTVEIAPSFAIEKDDVKEKLSLIPGLKRHESIYLASPRTLAL